MIIIPNRIIKESICTSDSIDNLTWFEEVFFYRLIVNCDDYGRFDGRPAILKSRLFPLKDITTKQIEDCLNKLASAGMVVRYTSNAKPFLQISTWENHQQIRNHKSKYPSLDEADNIQLKSIDINNNQLKSVAPVIQSNPIQSEYKSESESMLGTSSNVPSPVASLVLKDGTMFEVTEEMLRKYQKVYKNLDCKQEIEKMALWCDSTPAKRKTKAGISRFINNWLSRESEKGGNSSDETNWQKSSW